MDGELRFRSETTKKAIMSVFRAQDLGSCIFSVAESLLLNITDTIVEGKLTYN